MSGGGGLLIFFTSQDIGPKCPYLQQLQGGFIQLQKLLILN